MPKPAKQTNKKESPPPKKAKIDENKGKKKLSEDNAISPENQLSPTTSKLNSTLPPSPEPLNQTTTSSPSSQLNATVTSRSPPPIDNWNNHTTNWDPINFDDDEAERLLLNEDRPFFYAVLKKTRDTYLDEIVEELYAKDLKDFEIDLIQIERIVITIPFSTITQYEKARETIFTFGEHKQHINSEPTTSITWFRLFFSSTNVNAWTEENLREHVNPNIDITKVDPVKRFIIAYVPNLDIWLETIARSKSGFRPSNELPALLITSHLCTFRAPGYTKVWIGGLPDETRSPLLQNFLNTKTKLTFIHISIIKAQDSNRSLKACFAFVAANTNAESLTQMGITIKHKLLKFQTPSKQRGSHQPSTLG